MSANCSTCHGTGKEKCKRCGTTGKEDCPDCRGTGRLACDHCRGHGYRIKFCKGVRGSITGIDHREYIVTDERCPYCEHHDEEYKECYDKWVVIGSKVTDDSSSVVCKRCGGTGKVKCSRCHGTKMQKCSECQEREDKARQAILAAQQKAKERAEARMGCGCLLIICAFICLVIWGPEWFAGTWIGSVLGWIRHASWDVIQWLWSAVKVIFGIIAACCMMIVGLVVALISMFIG